MFGDSWTMGVGGITLGVLALVRACIWFLPVVRRQLYVEPSREWVPGQASSDATIDSPSADQVYFDFAQRLLDSQISTSDILDTKASGIIGVGSTVLPLTFGLLAISGRKPPDPAIWLLALALVAYVCLLWTASRAFRIRAFEYRPDLMTLWTYSQRENGATLRRWVAEEYAASAETNRPLVIRKSRWVGWSNRALFAEGVLITLAAGTTPFW